MMNRSLLAILVLTSLTFALSPSVTSRLKDISRLENERENQLIGYGLVVGLAGTGDGNSSKATLQGISNMLSNFGVQIDAAKLDGSNVAAVMVTTRLKAFNVPGDLINVQVSSIGKAKSLRGGMLLLTPLKGANGDVYVVAQGPLSIGGFSVSDKGSSKSKNHPTAGMIPNGGIVEKAVETVLVSSDELMWVLDQEDYATIDNIRLAIRQKFPNIKVDAISGSKISVTVPRDYRNNIISLISQISNLEVKTDMVAKIVINEKTGSVVIGGPVHIAPVIIAHENLNISIQNSDIVSQPNPLSQGQTTSVKGSVITVENADLKKPLKVIETAESTIDEVVDVLNQVGVTPQDILIILQMMKDAGAIKGKLEII